MARTKSRRRSVSSPLRQERLFEPLRVLSVPVRLPVSLARRAYTEVYPYSFPRQVQLLRRTLRARLTVPRKFRREKWILTRVRIALPGYLPIVRGSMVSLAKGRLNVLSQRALKRNLLSERNRRRYMERKSNRRQARNGQLDSPGALKHGLVAHAYNRGASIAEIADAGLVARVMGGVHV